MRLVLFILFVFLFVLPQKISAESGKYILALSWSAAYCNSKSYEDERDDAQCSRERRYGFVVHGLWNLVPEGKPYAQYCSGGYSSHLSQKIVERMLPIMPSAGLVRYSWRKHGLCSGLSPDAYFDRASKAYSKFITPPEWLRIQEPVVRSKAQLMYELKQHNPELDDGMFMLTCDNKRFREVRVCLDSNLNYSMCTKSVLSKQCQRKSMTLEPIQ